ncbi:MAG TPA: methyltransferase domain-containing protein [Pseudonocardia sp.]|jgi:SAM-dependent methyltransferase
MTSTTSSPATTASGDGIDLKRVKAFAGRVMRGYAESMVTLMVDLAGRTGLLDALAAGPGTSAELADRAGLTERYVREILNSLVTGEIVEYEPAGAVYTLPREHAICLTGDGVRNMTPVSRVTTLLAQQVAAVAQAVRDGGGVPYEAFQPHFTEIMDAMSRGRMDGVLLTGILPTTGALPSLLEAGARVADIGCGTGHAANLMAQAYPRSQFVGYDLGRDAIAAATAEAGEMGLSNARFEVLDVTELPTDPPFDAVFAFDSIHDQVDPAGVLARVHEALVPGGTFVMVDIKASSRLEDNIGNPYAPWLYGVSTLHCMTVSLAHGGAGLGTAWGEQLARQMLEEAGFVDVSVHDIPDVPYNQTYLCSKPTT